MKFAKPLFDRCARGFTMPQKIAFTALGVMWVISPLDFDFIPLAGWIDDAFIIALLKSVWCGPTLPGASAPVVATHIASAGLPASPRETAVVERPHLEVKS